MSSPLICPARLSLRLISAMFCFVLAAAPFPATAAEFSIQPSIAISEEYSDNVNQTREKVSAFTTKVTPNINASYSAPFWDWDLNYNLEYRHYSEDVILDTGDTGQNDFRHTLGLRGLTRLVDNLLYLDISNVFERTDRDVLRRSLAPQFIEDEESEIETDQDQDVPVIEDIRNRDSTDRNTFSISPYFAFRLTPRTFVNTGYRYTDIWYRDENSDNSEEHHTFAQIDYQLTRQWGLNTGYSSTWKQWDNQDGVDKDTVHNVFGGASYTYRMGSRIYVDFGVTWREREQPGTEDNDTSTDPFVRAGFRHRFTEATTIFGEITTPITPTRGETDRTDLTWNAGIRQLIGRYIATFVTTVRFVDDPVRERTRQETVYSAVLSRPYGRGSASLIGSYSEFDEPDETKYSTGLNINHSLTRRLTGNAGLFFEQRDTENQTTIDEWRTLFGLNYLLMQDLSVSFRYQYTDSTSTEAFSDDNFQENRVTLELRKTF